MGGDDDGKSNRFKYIKASRYLNYRVFLCSISALTLLLYFWSYDFGISSSKQSLKKKKTTKTTACIYDHLWMTPKDFGAANMEDKKIVRVVTFHAGSRLVAQSSKLFGSTSSSGVYVRAVPFPPTYHNWRMSLHTAGYFNEAITTLGENFVWGLNEDKNWLGRTEAYLNFVKSLDPSECVVSNK
jgi:hypothetical protein